MRTRLFILVLVAVLAGLMAAPIVSFARGGGGGGHSSGGGSHSSSSSHSSSGGFSGGHSSSSSSGGFSGGSSSSSGGFSHSTPSGSSSGGFSGPGGGAGGFSKSTGTGSSSSRTSSSPQIGGASKSMYDKAKMNGTAYTSRDQAVGSFKSKYSSQYTNKFAKEPAARPDYIPQNATINGQRYPVVYNINYGGYGYWGYGHHWMMYDVFADAVMLDVLMSRRNYYYGPSYYDEYGRYPQPMQGPMAPVVVVHRQSHFLGWLLGLGLLGLLIWAISAASRRAAARQTMGGMEGSEVYAPVAATVAAPVVAQTWKQSVGPAMFDPNVLEHWRSIAPGSVILLKDKQALQDSMDAGLGLKPLEYTVDESRRIVEQNNLGEWCMLHLVDPRPEKQETWFVTLGVDNNVEHRIYFQPDDGFVPGTRREIIDRSGGADRWLFQEPADPNHYTYSELLFTTEINYGGVTYTQKGGTLYGEATTNPAQTGLPSPLFSSVTEYIANTDCENPEIMVLELGGVAPGDTGQGDEGGLIRLLLGAQIQPNDFEVLPK